MKLYCAFVAAKMMLDVSVDPYIWYLGSKSFTHRMITIFVEERALAFYRARKSRYLSSERIISPFCFVFLIAESSATVAVALQEQLF